MLDRTSIVFACISAALFFAIVSLFIMAEMLPNYRARGKIPQHCDVVMCERGRGRSVHQAGLVKRNMAAFGGKVRLLVYTADAAAAATDVAAAIDGVEISHVAGKFVSYQSAVADAAGVCGGDVAFVFLGDQVAPLHKFGPDVMFSATGKYRFFGGEDSNDTDASFSMYNETIAPVVVFNPAAAAIDDEYIYRLHFAKQLRHATDLAYDVFMMRDVDMNRTQVQLAKESGRRFATFHLPNEVGAKIPQSERAQRNTELLELMGSLMS